MPARETGLVGSAFVDRLKVSLIRGRPGTSGPIRQKQLAEDLGMNPQTVSRWTRGETRPSDADVERLRRYFGWTPEDVLELYTPERPQGDPRAFTLWREAVGFEAGFPRLRPLRKPAPAWDRFGHETPTRDSVKFFLNQMHREKLMNIRESLAGRSVVVTTAPGHGATTLARFLYLEAEKDAVVRKAIPIFVSLEQVLSVTYPELQEHERAFLQRVHPRIADRVFNPDPELVRAEADDAAQAIFGAVSPRRVERVIADTIRESVVRSLILQRWEHVLNRSLYKDLLGAGSATSEAFEDRRAALAPILNGQIGEAQWSALALLGGRLGNEDYRAIIRELNRDGNVRIRLMFDLSATPMGRQYLGDPTHGGTDYGEYLTAPYIDAIKDVMTAVRNLKEQFTTQSRPRLPTLLDTAYFISREAWAQLDGGFTLRTDARIDFPPYRPLDVFAMLAYHYPPSWGEHRGRVELLSAVLDSEFVRITESTALSTETVILESELRARLSDRKVVNYHQRRQPVRAEELDVIHARLAELEARIGGGER